jgi:hypothetical protein
MGDAKAVSPVQTGASSGWFYIVCSGCLRRTAGWHLAMVKIIFKQGFD